MSHFIANEKFGRFLSLPEIISWCFILIFIFVKPVFLIAKIPNVYDFEGERKCNY